MNWLIQHSTMIGVFWLAASAGVLIYWAGMTRFGWQRLKNRPIRENYLQLPVLLAFFVAMLMTAGLLSRLLSPLHSPPSRPTTSQPASRSATESATAPTTRPTTRPVYVVARTITWPDVLSNLLSQAVLFAGAVLVSRRAFVRGVRGVGLTGRPMLADIGAGLLCFAVILPMVQYTAYLTAVVYDQFHWVRQQHELLRFLHTHPSRGTVGLVVVTAVLTGPLWEEIFFRGLIQSFFARFYRLMIPPKGNPGMALTITPPEFLKTLPGPTDTPLTVRQEATRAVLAIVTTSLAFAMMHDPMSRPAIFLLAVAIGYVYEVRGSLITCITMHAAFNGLNLGLSLLTS